MRSGEGLTSLITNNRANFSGAKKRTVKLSRVYIFRAYAKKLWVACITGPLWAKQGERRSLSEARDDSRSSRASRKMPRSLRLVHKAPVMKANFESNLFFVVVLVLESVKGILSNRCLYCYLCRYWYYCYIVNRLLWLFLFFLCSLQVPLHLVVKYFLEGYPNYSNIVVWLSIIVGQPLAILCYFHDYYVSSVQVCARKCSLCQALREKWRCFTRWAILSIEKISYS